MFIYPAIKHYKELWRVEDRAWSERLKSVRADSTTETVWGQIHWNPLWKQKIMSQKLKMSTQSSHVSSGTIYTKRHLLTPALKEIWQIRAKHLLQWHAENGHENILLTDEKIFIIEKQYNNQQNKIYTHMSLEVRSECAGRPSPFLCHDLVGGVLSGGDTSSFLQERGQTGVRVYQEGVL